ncbi:MAG: cation transporter, partial [Pseudomonadota bacterium]|nr:cation transporter [Pseudomonadota bacterium]
MEPHQPGTHSDDHDHDHDHDHADGHAHGHHGHVHSIADGMNARMGIALMLNLTFVVIEGSFGLASNSVALIA